MGRAKSKANYFTKETEEYIVRYNESTDHVYRAQIFTDHIYHPFYKLAENIIHTFKFYYTDVPDIEDLKHEIVTVLLEEKIMKFDPTYGAKAFSYFGTIVKRWLINYNNKNYKKLLQHGNFDNLEENIDDTDRLYGKTADPYHDSALTLGQLIDLFVEKTYDRIETLFSKESELKVADAVLTIFKTRNDIGIFKKKALYIYIREMTDCETPHLTRVISKLKIEFYELYQKYEEEGLIIHDRNYVK